jgi:multidrug efflux pump
MVIFLFLRKLRATIIPSVAVPLSIVGTFGVMYLVGLQPEQPVPHGPHDLDGLRRRRRHRHDREHRPLHRGGREAVRSRPQRAEQIGFTIVSLTVSLIAVFIPLLFMGGIVGRLFREFAITLSVAIMVSAVVSLTLTPMMCSRLLFYVASERAFNSIIAFYGRTLKWVLKFQNATLLVAAATLVLTIFLYVIVPKGFFPVQDTGIIQGISEASQSISFEAMSEKQQQLTHVILQDPAVESVSSFIGIDGTNTTLNSGRIQINLKPLEQRKTNASDIIRRLQPNLEKIDGITLYMQPVQDLTVEDRVSRTQYQYTLEDPDQRELNQWTARLMAKLQTIPELRDLATDQQTSGLAASLIIDRVTASRMGITPQAIDQTLYDAFGQRQVSTLYTQVNQYHIILETEPDFQKGPAKLQDIYVRSALAPSALTSAGSSTGTVTATTSSGNSASSAAPSPSASTNNAVSAGSANPTPIASINGGAVPLGAFTHFEMKSGPLSVSHQGQFPVVTISFNLAPNASLGAATQAIDKAQQEIGMPLSVQGAFQGTAASFQASLSNEPILILAALVTVYIVLGVLYESYIHPLTILSTLPSAGVGAILALLICGQELSVVALIGIILLIGIVKKNGIMMIDFALEAERKEGKKPEDAIYEACLLRFRPIMMTTMAALLAGLPLALGTGIGSELRRPLGISMVGGLLLSQILTLYTTPVIYIFFDRLAQRFTSHRASEGGTVVVPAD